MGGYGSGQWHGARPTTDQALRLDVRWLARAGLIHPTVSGWMPLSWTRDGSPVGDIMVRYDGARPDELVLAYRTRDAHDTDWTDVREVVRLVRTPCHFGGDRIWCRCPGCGSRRAVLYGLRGRFRCVRCHKLAYGVTREEPLFRYGRRGDKILEKLGAKREWVLNWLAPPPRPKGMHQRTYERLVREWETVRRGANHAYCAGLLHLFERSERARQERGHNS